MLSQLLIRDLAIVSAQELELQPGFSVLTGETGAGKSILIDALGLALGDRADNAMIRSGSERAEVSADFDIRAQPEVRAWLQAQDLDADNACLIRRVLSREGRSRAFINGRPAPIQQVQELGNLLVEIHGQHAHQSLLKRNHQRLLLDAYGGEMALAGRVAASFKRYRKSQQQLAELTTAAADRASRLDLLRFQLDELTALNLRSDELESLTHDHKRLSHLGQLRNSCNYILEGLDEADPSARGLLVRLSDEFDALQPLDESLSEPREMLENALIQIDETLAFLRDYLAGLELDPAELQQIEQRLEAIHDMARKYRVNPKVLPERLGQIQEELEQLEHADVALTELQNQVADEHAAYLKSARELSGKRRTAAKRLGQEISEAMQQIGMPGGIFSAALRPVEASAAGSGGLEQVEFLVSANPGMPPQPLNKVASGGELSRISLAIQVATIRYGQTPTLLFDEVDVGIGGGVAQRVGQMLRNLGDSRQILCVTHLPQVAAQAEQHLQVNKSSTRQQTHTEITTLNKQERVHEIARMLGGVEITDQTLAHASEMIELAAVQ
ncbi:MAG: DNA repair protein RecN [Pseudomonadota bacterium]